MRFSTSDMLSTLDLILIFFDSKGATVFSYVSEPASTTDQSTNTSIIENAENDASDWMLSLTNLAEDKTGASPSDAWFTTANYAGAFDPAGDNGAWLKGWTYLDENGKL